MAPRDDFFANRVLVSSHATAMSLLSYARRPDSIRRTLRLVRCILHCGKCTLPSHFTMFKTCFCTVRLCFHDANLICLDVRCIPTRTRKRGFLRSKKCCGGGPEHHAFSQCFKDDTKSCNEGPSHGKACMDSNLFRVFST